MRPSESNNSKTQEHDDMHLWLQDPQNQMKIIDLIISEHKEDKSPELDKVIKNIENKKIIEVARLRIGEIKTVSSDYDIKHLEIERPMYSGYHLQGICDAILTWDFHIIYYTYFQKLIRNTTGDGKIRCDGAYGYVSNHCNKCDSFVSPEEASTAHKSTYDIDESIEPILELIPEKIYEKSGHVLIELKPKLNSVSGIIGQIKTYRDVFKRQHPSVGTGMLCCAVITYDTNTKYDSILKAENIHLIRIERNESKVDDHQQTLSCM